MLYTHLIIILFTLMFFQPICATTNNNNDLELLNNILFKSQKASAKSINTQQAINKLYYFISFSMPIHLIKQYLQDAIKTEAIVIIRGIDKDSNLRDFILQKIFPVVQSGNQQSTIEINPKLFDMFSITAVPTIVLVQGDNYWKVTGAVSSLWALQAFAETGAPAQAYLQRLSSNRV